ncbi:MAG: ribosome recycling factor [Eubacteriales bacterium]|nr:ribosome recycling factor [Eubacteriales bacterium]
MADLQQFRDNMNKTISVLEEEYATIRAGRANPNILNRITVDYYGTPTPLQQVAGISVPEARLIVIQPWEASLVKDIEKAILASDIGITPNNDGKVIRLNFPDLTEERRKELAKDIKKRGEDAKVSIRNIRREAIDVVKKEEKAGDISEDELRDEENEIQKMTDDFVKKIDQMIDTKSDEVMTV